MSDPEWVIEWERKLLENAHLQIPNLVLLDGFLPKYRVGATVRLKSGSPMLTVTAIHHGHVEVQWFEGTDAKQKIYPVAALQEARKRRKVHV